MVLDFAEQKLVFKEQEKSIMLVKVSHLLAKLELVVRWKDKDAVILVEKEKNVQSIKSDGFMDP